MPSRAACGEHRARPARGRPKRRCPTGRSLEHSARRRASPGCSRSRSELLEQRRRPAIVKRGEGTRRRRSVGSISTPSTPPAGTKRRRVGTRLRATQQAARPLCPHYRSGGIQPQRPAGYGPRRPLTKSSGILVNCRRSAAKRPGTCIAVSAPRKPLRHTGTVAIVDGPAMFLRAVVVSAALVAFAPSALARDARSQAKEQVDFGIKVAQSGLWKEAIVPMAEGGRARSHLLRRVEQPGDRLRAAGKLRGGPEGLREGRTAGSEEPDDPAELRSLQRNQ